MHGIGIFGMVLVVEPSTVLLTCLIADDRDSCIEKLH